MPKCVNVRLSGSELHDLNRLLIESDGHSGSAQCTNYSLQVKGLTMPVARQSPKTIPIARATRQIQTAFRSPNFSVSHRPLAVL